MGRRAIVVARSVFLGASYIGARLLLYPFRYRSEVTGKWVRARYKAEREVIATRHTEWEIIGPPEVIDVDPETKWQWFNPYRATPEQESKRLREPAPQLNPHLGRPPAIDALECFLVAAFLRRYTSLIARGARAMRPWKEPPTCSVNSVAAATATFGR